MKKVLSIGLLLFLTVSIVSANRDATYTWLFDNGLTTMTKENFRENDPIVRGEAAKFYVGFAQVQ